MSVQAIALVYGTVMRNLSIALAIAITVFGPGEGAEIALIVAMGYIIQVQSAAWYVKLTDKIFGTPTVEAQFDPNLFMHPYLKREAQQQGLSHIELYQGTVLGSLV